MDEEPQVGWLLAGTPRLPNDGISDYECDHELGVIFFEEIHAKWKTLHVMWAMESGCCRPSNYATTIRRVRISGIECPV